MGRSLPVPSGAHRVVLRQPGQGLLPLPRLRCWRRCDRVRAVAARARLHRRDRMARGALQRGAELRGGQPGARRPPAWRRPPPRAAGADGRVLRPRAAAEPARRGRAHLPGRAQHHGRSHRALPARLLAGRAAGRRRRARPRLRRPRDRGVGGCPRQPHGTRRSHGGAADLHAQRPPRAPDRVRGPAPAARRVRSQVRELAREPALAQERDALRPASRAHRDRARGGGDRRRGLHRRDWPLSGGIRERRGLDGDVTDPAAAA